MRNSVNNKKSCNTFLGKPTMKKDVTYNYNEYTKTNCKHKYLFKKRL